MTGSPLVTALATDVVVHDLAADAAALIDGAFTPAGPRVTVEVQSAYSFLGCSRGALLLYVAQVDDPTATLHDCGGKPLPGVSWHSMGSVNGESAWAQTTGRRLVIDVDPARPVRWQLIVGILGGARSVAVPGARVLAMTPDSTRLFVASPHADRVTPILLGRPEYSYDQARPPMDAAESPIVCPHPTHLSAGDAHVVVSHGSGAPRVSIITVGDHRDVREVDIPDGAPLGTAVSPDGGTALVGTTTGALVRIDVATGAASTGSIGKRIESVAFLADGTTAFAADSHGGVVHRVHVPDLSVEARIECGEAPRVVRVAPDGRVWALRAPAPPERGRLTAIDPRTNAVVDDHELPHPDPLDVAIVPVAGQSSTLVRSAWVAFGGGRYCQFYIGGTHAGQAHSFHNSSFEGGDAATGVAVNDIGEIWVAQPALDGVWRWLGGRFQCRADPAREHGEVIYGEYCEVHIHGGSPLAVAPVG